MMEAMNLVEVVLNQGNDEDNDKRVTQASDIDTAAPIKGLNESVSITVTRTPGRPANAPRQSGKPANFALLSSPARNGRNSDAIRETPREEMVCNGCQRTFKYKAAFTRHEAQCGLPLALRIERAAVIEAKRAEKAAEVEKRKIEEKQEKQEKPPLLKCPTCLKQFYDNDAFQNHDFEACATERSSYTFVCAVCNARFKYKNHLRRHEDSHNNVRRYNCEVCTTAFLRPDHLKRHMMRMHGIVQLSAQGSTDVEAMKSNPDPGVVSTSDEKNTLTTIKNAPMQCPMCSKILSRRDHVLRHMRNVHHINYESRKRGAAPEFLNSPESMMDQNGMNPCQDNGDNNEDCDESENQSMTSHDGLMIDESFESIKRESSSPPLPERSNEPLYRGTTYASTTSRNLMDETYQRNEAFLKQQTYHYRPCDNVRIKSEINPVDGNFINNCNGNSMNNVGSNLRVPDRYGQHPVLSHETVLRHDPNAELKSHPHPMDNRDGNQSVLCNSGNGLSARMAGTNWMSDLTSYSSW